MSQQLAHPVQEVLDAGFDVELFADLMVVGPVAYRRADGGIGTGSLGMQLLRQAGGVVDPRPPDHTAYWIAKVPFDDAIAQRLVNDPSPRQLAENVAAICQMSRKMGVGGTPEQPEARRDYESYLEKTVTYSSTIERMSGQSTQRPTQGSLLDHTNSSTLKAATSSSQGLYTADQKLADETIAIIGLGGTGGHVLDMVAKTNVRSILLFDPDSIADKNLRRWPGAIHPGSYAPGDNKAEFLSQKYRDIHPGIVAYPIKINESEFHRFTSVTTAFVCVDDSASRLEIASFLAKKGVRFIDVGIGMHEEEGELWGNVRVTAFDPQTRNHDEAIGGLPKVVLGDAMYDRNIQICEFNGLNAMLAVMRWKQLVGYYRQGGASPSNVRFHLASWSMIAEGGRNALD